MATHGKIVDNCLQCPFHNWKIGCDGAVKEVPYLKNPKECPSTRTVRVFPCVDFCGAVYFYFHADGRAPEYELPSYVAEELKNNNWSPHLKWDVGYRSCTPVDWVDQAGDHAHFFYIHRDFMVPFTLIEFPAWLKRLIPLGITHELTTFRGDDAEWRKTLESDPKVVGVIEPRYIFFKDRAGLTWNGEVMETTVSDTFETYIGPSLIIFNIPFTIGSFKAFVSMTPCEGGCVMRVRTWIDERTKKSWFVSFIAWLLVGISTSNLANDLLIVEKKLRLKKPLLQPFDGPYNRVNAWMKQFYSESSEKVGTGAYCPDW